MKEQSEVVLSIIAYSLCSGTLVLLNKLILHNLPYPSLVVSFQLVAALIFIYSAKFSQKLQVDEVQWKYVVPYLYYTVLFTLGVYCNMKSLSISNVETVIVFRALSPCFVAFLDAIFLGREYPSARSWTGLLIIVAGAYGYANFDEKLQTQGLSAYAWPTLYMLIISLEMAYGKRIIKSVDLQTLSGPVLYTNLLGLLPMLMLAAMAGEYQRFVQTHMVEQVPIKKAAIVFLLLGCVAGTGIGYAGWWCRDKVSATTFTLVGVMNKCLTIILNLLIWDQHAKTGGILSLVLCLVGGSIYQQSPMRPSSNTAGGTAGKLEAGVDGKDNVASDSESVKLLERSDTDPDGNVSKRRSKQEQV